MIDRVPIIDLLLQLLFGVARSWAKLSLLTLRRRKDEKNYILF